MEQEEVLIKKKKGVWRQKLMKLVDVRVRVRERG